MKTLYHASPTHGLTVLTPRVSSHGKPYVYAIENRIAALCFGAPKDDFDLLTWDADGVPVLFECYPDAARRVYLKKSCSLYTVDGDLFSAGRTGWSAEYVCESDVPVLCEQTIPDVYAELVEARARGECFIYPYSDSEEHLSVLREELGERVKLFGLTKDDMEKDERFKKYFTRLFE